MHCFRIASPEPLPLILLSLAWFFTASDSSAQNPLSWNASESAQYLDERAQAWFDFQAASRGQGQTKTTCLCCHTVVPYALARPALRRLSDSPSLTVQEQRLVRDVSLRVNSWDQLDTPAFRLMYFNSDQKKLESRGTEAVLNALTLAVHDSTEEMSTSSDETLQAMDNLWREQIQTGDRKGSFEWLNFSLEPWESKRASYYGAALAALAVATAPSYLNDSTADEVKDHVASLASFLRANYPGQDLHNRTWALRASTILPGVLTADDTQQLIGQLKNRQNADGGWSLASLGNFTRLDDTPQATASDGYATGLIVSTLLSSGHAANEDSVARGLAWLRQAQADDGSWQGYSLNEQRDTTSHVGKFMSDAATSYAILALTHAD